MDRCHIASDGASDQHPRSRYSHAIQPEGDPGVNKKCMSRFDPAPQSAARPAFARVGKARLRGQRKPRSRPERVKPDFNESGYFSGMTGLEGLRGRTGWAGPNRGGGPEARSHATETQGHGTEREDLSRESSRINANQNGTEPGC